MKFSGNILLFIVGFLVKTYMFIGILCSKSSELYTTFIAVTHTILFPLLSKFTSSDN